MQMESSFASEDSNQYGIKRTTKISIKLFPERKIIIKFKNFLAFIGQENACVK